MNPIKIFEYYLHNIQILFFIESELLGIQPTTRAQNT